MKRRFDMTPVEPADRMREPSRRLNAGCGHLPGDTRTVGLGRLFDAVVYVTAEGDLRADPATVA